MHRLTYRIARLRSDPLPLIAAAAALVLAYVILGPVISVVSAAFVAHPGDPGVREAPGQPTWFYLERMFTSDAAFRLFYQPLLHSLALAALTTLVSIVLGVSAGWLLARTDLPGGRRWVTVMMLAYMVPSWAFAQTWLTVFKNGSAAGGTGLLQGAGIRVPDALAYGLLPSVIVLSLHTFPLVMMLSADAFTRIDAAQEEAARLLGASRPTILRRVLLPSVRPAVLSSALLIAANAIGDFGVPYVLGLPTQWNVLATSLFGELRNNREGTSSVLATVVTVLGVLLITGDSLLSRNARRFESVSGGTARTERTRLGGARVPAAAYLGVLALVAFVLPLVVLAGSTLVAQRGNAAGGLTLDFWWKGTGDADFPDGLLRTGQFWQALLNTLWVAGLAAVVCAVVGILVAVLVKHSPGRLGGLLRQLTFLPHLLPGVSLAAGLIALFVVARGPIPALYGTFGLIILGMVVSHLPFATRAGIAAVSQLGAELDDAARVTGAGWFTTLRRITLPLVRGAFGTAILFPFISAMKDLTLVVMLSTFAMPFLPSLSLDLSEKGLVQQANAVTFVITVLAVLGGVLTRRLGGGASAALAA